MSLYETNNLLFSIMEISPQIFYLIEYFSTGLKVLSSEMDPVEIRLIR